MTNVYIGWDSREPIAADVCELSMVKNATCPLNIHMLKQQELRNQGLYVRDPDGLSSTEFTFTRFLVPYLNEYRGWAVFVDCDFLWLGDIKELIEQADDRYAAMVVKHDYRPQGRMKMDGKRQLYYPRKNWSSMVLFNCAHPKNQWLTLGNVNHATGQELHRFSWLDDSEIGSLKPEWNWLVGWYYEPWDGEPKALHYTEGGPWFENYRDCEYAQEWFDYEQLLKKSYVSHDITSVDKLHLPDTYQKLFSDIIEYVENPYGINGTMPNKPDIDQWLQSIRYHQLIGITEAEDLTKKMKQKGARWDGIVHAFVQGAAGCMASYDMVENSMQPIALRSIAKKKIMNRCLENGRDFYYIDTGYFGNGKLKDYHRITKNAMQWLGPVEDRPADRLERTRVRARPMTPGSKILICPPSAKAMSYWNLDEEQWVTETIATLKTFTDRPIVVRLKQPREVRATVDTMEQALSDDIHAMVTFNSIAAVESLIYGKPVFALGPNAAAPCANTDLSLIETPYVPDLDEVTALLKCLAYHQFTVEEMHSGYAWAVINGQA